MSRRTRTAASRLRRRLLGRLRPLPICLRTESISRRHNFAVGLLPIGLMFAGLIVLVYLTTSVATAMGISLRGPALHDARSFLFVIAFLFTFVVLVLAGYLLGFILNAAILRIVFRWNGKQLRDLFLYSRLPPHWRRTALDDIRAARFRKRTNHVAAIVFWCIGVALVVMNWHVVRAGRWGWGALYLTVIFGVSVLAGILTWREVVEMPRKQQR